MDSLKQAVRTYVSRHANRDGVAVTPVPGLRMKCVESPQGILHAICRPLIIFVLQGAKVMTVGREQRLFSTGQSVIVSADLPLITRIVQASRSEPYLAIAIELEMAILREVTAQLGSVRAKRPSETRTLFSQDTEAAALDCASRHRCGEVLRPGNTGPLSQFLDSY